MNKFLLIFTAVLIGPWVVQMPAAQLLDTGSFEVPRVKARTPLSKGGNPLRHGGKPEWLIFTHARPQKDGGSVTAGLTNEIARSGRQSLFIEFNKFTAINSGVTLAGDFISIQPGKPYRVSIWGILNKKNPLTFDQRIPYLVLMIEFYSADKETQTGDPVHRIQPMPDTPNRLAGRPPLFTAARWAEYFADVEAPEDAAFMKVTWKWETTTREGETSGLIYFDDATIQGEPGPVPPPDPEDEALEAEMKEIEKTIAEEEAQRTTGKPVPPAVKPSDPGESTKPAREKGR